MTRQDFLDKVFNYEKSSAWTYQGSAPCVIDFHDESCPPCKHLEPILGKLSEEYDGRVIFYKVDIKAEKDLAEEVGIQNLPTLVFCPLDDKPIVMQGAAPREKVVAAIEKELLA